MKKIKAKEILDSNKKPTLEVELKTDWGSFAAAVPSGVSTGRYEAVELRDEDGGVKLAVNNIEKIIAPVLEKEKLDEIDKILIGLDGTENKSRLGANAILAVSIAVCRAIAASKKLPLFQYISRLSEFRSPTVLPKPSFNMIEGGKHAENGLAFQEFMIIPQKESFRENLEIGEKIYKKLGEILRNKFKEVKLSAEGAFAPPLKENKAALDLILEAAKSVGEENNIKIAIDVAASEFSEEKDKLLSLYEELILNYPIASIEDPFGEEDFESFAQLKNKIGDRILIFGDDLTVSNIERIKLAQEKDACNGLILKPNQIGTVTETIEAARLAKSFGWKIMVANRAGETEDDFIADLAVGINADFIKSGAPFPKERMTKYNRLVKIEEELSSGK